MNNLETKKDYPSHVTACVTSVCYMYIQRDDEGRMTHDYKDAIPHKSGWRVGGRPLDIPEYAHGHHDIAGGTEDIGKISGIRLQY